jgi:hypothetical protein
MIAAPDASARRWSIEPRIERPLAPPFDVALDAKSSGGSLHWTQPGPVRRIRIARAADPRFAKPLADWVIDLVLLAGAASPPADPWQGDALFMRLSWTVSDDATDIVFAVARDAGFNDLIDQRPVTLQGWPGPAATCPSRHYWRLGADDESGRQSPWSQTVWARLPASHFTLCPDDQLPAPVLSLSQPAQVIELNWTAPAAGDLDYRLEMSPEPLFLAPRTVYSGAALGHLVWNAGDRIWYFRVAAASGARQSPWSAGVATGAVREERRLVEPVTAYEPDVLLTVHAALITLAAARGDLHAVLGLAQHFRGPEIAAYRGALLPRIASGSLIPGEADDLDRALSYAVLYHPWTLVRETAADQSSRVWNIAPEALLTGVIAARALTSGAWAAAANQLLPGVVGLAPNLAEGDLPASALPLNLLVDAARGFTTLSEWTLGLAGEVRALHVRRLLILLRRLALREGTAFAFLPNDPSLARLIQREFEAVLGDLYARGAFAGRSAAEGFQVIADSRINTDATRDQGRLLVELRVAPSEPLGFLTIRLVQTSGDQLRVQEG